MSVIEASSSSSWSRVKPVDRKSRIGVYRVVHPVDRRLEVLLITFPDGEEVIIGIEYHTFLHVNHFQSSSHLHCIILDSPEVYPLHRFNHEVHDPSCLVCFDLPCIQFLLLPFLDWCTECRGLGSTRNDTPER
jgi:hypothetical protein